MCIPHKCQSNHVAWTIYKVLCRARIIKLMLTLCLLMSTLKCYGRHSFDRIQWAVECVFFFFILSFILDHHKSCEILEASNRSNNKVRYDGYRNVLLEKTGSNIVIDKQYSCIRFFAFPPHWCLDAFDFHYYSNLFDGNLFAQHIRTHIPRHPKASILLLCWLFDACLVHSLPLCILLSANKLIGYWAYVISL